MLQSSKDGNGCIVYNLSKPENYYSQRNNQIDPMNTCAPTSMIQALEVAGYSFPTMLPNYRQPEDKLTFFLRNDKRVLAFWKNLDPSTYNDFVAKKKDCYQPNEIHAVLSYGTNLFMGKTVTQFICGYGIDSIVQEILAKQKPCVLSGKFGKLNHLVTLVGCAVKESNRKPLNQMKFSDIEYFLIDDTYGFTGDYKAPRNGNDVIITPKRFLNEFKNLSDKKKKWCHIIL